MKRTKIWAVLLLWVTAVSFGMLTIRRYESTPGKPARQSANLPVTPDFMSADQATLVMFAHPQCPCTRASIAQLDRILTEVQNRISAKVVFAIPDDVRQQGDAALAEWHGTALVKAARAIPGVAVSFDDGGNEAKKFGANTSGHVFMYTSDRRLFQGGITDARGHEGENLGHDVIVQIVNGQEPMTTQTEVFGCQL